MAAIAVELEDRASEGIRANAPHEEEPLAVAVILSDGTVRMIGAGRSEGNRPEWQSGVVSGSDWTLWWECRSWSEAP